MNCVSLLSEGYLAGNGSVPSANPSCNIDDGEDTDFVAVCEKGKMMMGKRKEICFNLEKAEERSSSDVNPSELRSVSGTQQLGGELMDR